MKRLIALALCAIFTALCFVSCAYNPDDRGPILPVYLTQQEANLDPSKTIYDKDVVKYTTLLFEGLTVIKENGSVAKGLAESWKTDFNDERGEYFIEFTLKDTHWSDGRALLADHFVYAWKRILSPATASDAACLLYDIKNATKVKSGEMTPDDLGVSAPNGKTLRVQLEKKMDIDLFLEAVASPALVPLRYDVLGGETADNWATTTENLLSCGPFAMSAMDDYDYVLDKSSNYLLSLDPEVKENPNKYVKPAKLATNYEALLADHWNKLLNDELHYIDVQTIPEGAESFIDDIKYDDLLSTTSVFMNNKNAVLSDAAVRRALSLALDRNSAAQSLGFAASPATGFVSYGVFDKKNNSSFREEGGDLISTAADLNTAKSLLSGKNIKEELKLTYRATAHTELAKYMQGVWTSLGFKITLDPVSDEKYEKMLASQEFDLFIIDFQGLSTSAYSYLMPFSAQYSGNRVDLDGAFTTPHMTGFDNKDYNALADQVLAATERADRVELLHQMEAKLIEEMPIIPIAFWSNCYIVSDSLKGLEFSGFGTAIFTQATVKNYYEANEAWTADYEARLETRTDEEEQ